MIIPNFEQDVASPQTGYYTIKGKSHNHNKPTLFITAQLYNEWNYITKDRDDEIAAFWLTKELGDGYPHFLAYDMYIPRQTVSGTLASMDGDSIREMTNEFKPYFPNNGMHKHFTHVHLHPKSMAANWSGTDLKQQNTRGELGFESDYRIYVVTNGNMDIYASYVVYLNNNLIRVDDIGIGIYTVVHTPLTKARKEELDSYLPKPKSSPDIKPSFFSDFNYNSLEDFLNDKHLY